MMVKICGITNLEDALAAVDCGASALGFNFYSKSPRYITPQAAAGIVSKLPAGITKVGVFVNAETEDAARIAGLDVVQLHGDESPNDVPANIRTWKAFRVAPEFDLQNLDAWHVEAFLLDSPSSAYGGSGNTFDWRLARAAGRKIILAGGLDAANVRAAIEQAQPFGVDACSLLESTPGRKDHQKVSQFIQAALRV
jgi:phosphoribosylanthranilate isomerase